MTNVSAVDLEIKAKRAIGYYTLRTEILNACVEAAEAGEFECMATVPSTGVYKHLYDELQMKGFRVYRISDNPTIQVVIKW